MANVKNFGLIGVGENVQYGKGGSRIINNAGTFNFKNAAGGGDVAITTAGITSSAGNVTLTTGNLVMTSSAGTLSVGGDTTLSRHDAGIFQFDGTAAVVMPSGTTGQQPTAAGNTGGMRYNSTLGVMEYSNGTTWSTLATGGAAVTAVSVATANGLAGSSSGGTTPTLTLSTTVTGILKGDGTAISAAVSGTDLKTVGGNSIIGAGDVGTIGPTYGGTGLSSFASGTVLYASGANTWAAAAPGATSGVQPYDTDLTALANTATTGIYVVTGSGTSATRSLVAPAAGITITDPDGVAGAPTFALSDDLAAVEGLTGTGYAVRTGTSTWTNRTINGVSGRTVVTNGDGVASNTDIDLATVTNPGNGGTFVKITTDAYGRVSNSTAVVASDITSLVDATYVNVAGDSMDSAASLTFSGGGTVTGLPNPTNDSDAANKAYVDAVAQGLHVHEATDVVQNTNIGTYTAGSGAGNGVGAYLTVPATTVIDGFTLVTGSEATASRIMVRAQTNANENGVYYAASTTQWIRATDFDTPAEVMGGDFIFNMEGSTFANTGWVQTEDVTNFNTSPQVFQQFSGAGSYSAGTGLTLTGTVFSVNLGAGIGEFNTNNVGIDLYTPTTGGLILTTDGTTRSTSNAGQLYLLTGQGLTQDATGLYIANDGITNAMLANDSFTINGDSGTPNQVALGDTFLIAGTSTQGINTAVTADTITITAANASSSQKGVATFDATQFTVTAGNVVLGSVPNSVLPGSGTITITADTGSDAVALGESLDFNGDSTFITTSVASNVVSFTLGTVDVAHGGTGQTTLLDTAILIGNGTGAVEASTALTYDSSTDVLTIGGATGLSVTAAGGDVTIAALDTNADININPNGTGSVIIGPAGAGLIQSDSGQPLTVRGNTFLSLESVTGDTTMVLPASTSYKVTVSGPTAAQYSTGLADSDLVNKYYVDSVAGSAAGNIEAVSATVTLTNTTTNIGAVLPAGATILSVKVNVTAVDTGSGTLTVGKSGNTAAYMTAVENDTQIAGLYLAETDVTEGGSVQVIATSTGATSGTAKVIVTYQLAE